MRKQIALQKLSEQRFSFYREWFVRDNFIFAEGSCIADKPVAECNSALVALHIVCAHNAVLESAKADRRKAHKSAKEITEKIKGYTK